MSTLIYGIDRNRALYDRLQAQQSIALAIFKRSSCGHRRLGYRAKPTEFTWLIDPTGGISGHEDIGSDASIETSFRGTNHRYSVRFVRNLFQNRFSYAWCEGRADGTMFCCGHYHCVVSSDIER